MDMQLARTFLEVVAAGQFVRAAERLHVTQSTVSMRIRSLENELGRRLFVRSKAGAALTPAGEQFQRYASTLVQVWEQARHHVAVPPEFRAVLTIGGQFSLWDAFLLKWLPWMKLNAPDVVLRAEYGLPEWLMVRVVEGILDLGVMYTPQSRPGLKVEKLFEDRLTLVSTAPTTHEAMGADYVFVDWGPEFRSAHGRNFPDLLTPSMSLDLGSLALSHVLNNGGSGYFPERVIRPYLASGQLVLVPEAPVFLQPAYVVYSVDGDASILKTALEGLRHVAAMAAKT